MLVSIKYKNRTWLSSVYRHQMLSISAAAASATNVINWIMFVISIDDKRCQNKLFSLLQSICSMSWYDARERSYRQNDSRVEVAADSLTRELHFVSYFLFQITKSNQGCQIWPTIGSDWRQMGQIWDFFKIRFLCI